MEKFKTDVSDFAAEVMINGQKEMVASLYTQPLLFPDQPDNLLKSIAVHGRRVLSGISKSQRKGRLLATQQNAVYYLSTGENYGILCRRFEGWYIKSIMAYLKLQGINAVYEKMHEKGLGFTGYIIKRKRS